MNPPVREACIGASALSATVPEAMPTFAGADFVPDALRHSHAYLGWKHSISRAAFPAPERVGGA